MTRLVFFTILFFGIFFNVFAQNGIKGKILDKKNTPVAFANVLVLNPLDSSLVKGQVSDAEGKFNLSGLLEQKYLLVVKMVGYENAVLPFYLQKNQILELPNVVLAESETFLKEVQVLAEKPLFELKADRTVVNVQNSPTAAGSTVLDVLERSPNIEVDRVNNQISMNGKQGVVVMLNGKPTRMDVNALIQYLNGMSSSNIKKIELIHTPPASFDAQGNAGVINIETINSEEEGKNGTFTAEIGYGIRPKYVSSLNLTVRKGKMSFYTDLSMNNRYTQENTKGLTVNRTLDAVLKTEYNSFRPSFLGLYNGKMGLDYRISPRTTLGLMVSGSASIWKLDAQTISTVESNQGNFVGSNLRSFEKNDWYNLTTNFNFQHIFRDNSKISFDFDYLFYDAYNPTDYEENAFDRQKNTVSENNFRSRKISPIHFQVGKLDYSRQWNEKLKIETGLKATVSSFGNDVTVSNLRNENWETDNRFTDNLLMQERIYAGYVSTEYQFSKKTNLNIGLRFEQTHTLLTDKAEKPLLELNYGRFFPTVSFSHRFNDHQQIQFSYNERISRPPFFYLAPAFFFFSPNTILGGNPAVRPTVSRQLTLTYQYRSWQITGQISEEENAFLFQPLILEKENMTILRGENMKTNHFAMLSLSYSTEVGKWSSRYNFSSFVRRLQPIHNGKVQNRTDMYFTFNMTQSLKLPRNFNIELTNQTRSKRVYGFGENPFMTLFSVGVQRSFAEKHRFSLNWYDIFDSGSFWKLMYDQPELNMVYVFDYDNEGSIVRLSYTYNFGNRGVKKSNSRKTASEEERQRVN